MLATISHPMTMMIMTHFFIKVKIQTYKNDKQDAEQIAKH